MLRAWFAAVSPRGDLVEPPRDHRLVNRMDRDVSERRPGFGDVALHLDHPARADLLALVCEEELGDRAEGFAREVALSLGRLLALRALEVGHGAVPNGVHLVGGKLAGLDRVQLGGGAEDVATRQTEIVAVLDDECLGDTLRSGADTQAKPGDRAIPDEHVVAAGRQRGAADDGVGELHGVLAFLGQRWGSNAVLPNVSQNDITRHLIW